MTKEEFINHKDPLVLLTTFNPETGKVIWDTHDFETADMCKKDFEKDFPDMITFYYKNKAAAKQMMENFGFSDE